MQTGSPHLWGSQEPHVDENGVRRLRVLARIACIWVVLIVARLFYLQILSHESYKQRADSQQQKVQEVRAPRGTIYGRSGEALAMSTSRWSVVVNPKLVRNAAMTAELLAPVLEMEAQPLREKMEALQEQGRGYFPVKALVSTEEFERVKAMRLTGVEFREESARFYPKGSLAAHVLGGVDHEEHGNAGIELGLQEELEGIPGTERRLHDVKNNSYETILEEAPQPGKSIWLTIDERIQYIAEQALARAMEECRCKTGSVVVMDPRNGDILAMASYPTYDLNVPFKQGDDLSVKLNQAISAPFEPGSVFKVITLSAGLEKTRMGPDSPVNCLGGVITLHGRSIREAKNGFGVIPMRTVLAKSSNVGAIQVALQVGPKNLYEYIKRFGFGDRTGVPLPAEEPGVVYNPKNWGSTSIGSVAMGHEVTATTLQLAQAVSVVANDGRMVKPRIVLQRQRPGEPLEIEPVTMGGQVLRPENARRMREMMLDVVEVGTGTKAKIPGYNIGGKTGSAQIWDMATKSYLHKYNASFIGMAPLEKPRVAIAVTLTHSPKYGGVVATPVFHDVMAAALRLYDVPKDWDVPMPQIAKASLKKTEEEPESDNDVASAPPAPTMILSDLQMAYLHLTPNLLGKTMRDVLSETSAQGLLVETRGSGLAKLQRPAPGEVLQPGERILVEFAR